MGLGPCDLAHFSTLERQHEQMCSWWLKCTWVWNDITNVKADQRGEWRGEGNRTQARYETIVPKNAQTTRRNPQISENCMQLLVLSVTPKDKETRKNPNLTLDQLKSGQNMDSTGRSVRVWISLHVEAAHWAAVREILSIQSVSKTKNTRPKA